MMKYTNLDSALLFFKNVRFNSDNEGRKDKRNCSALNM